MVYVYTNEIVGTFQIEYANNKMSTFVDQKKNG